MSIGPPVVFSPFPVNIVVSVSASMAPGIGAVPAAPVCADGCASAPAAIASRHVLSSTEMKCFTVVVPFAFVWSTCGYLRTVTGMTREPTAVESRAKYTPAPTRLPSAAVRSQTN